VDVPFSEAVELLERSLENIMASMITGAPDRTVTNLLSGGVDSTLLQTFLPRSGRSLSVAIDTPEFAAETQRALSASALTGTDHQLVSLSESGYLEALERFITVTGLPPHHMQSVLFGEMFRLCEGERRYLVTAQFADALFGLHSLARAAGVLRRWGWLPVITRKRGLPAALKPARLRLAESWSELLDQRVGSTEGLAARAASYTDFAVAERAFGAARIRSRLERRLQYVLDICPFLSTAESGHDAQLEAAHLVDYFCDDAVSIWRQAAMSYGAYLISPFTHPEIFRSSLRFSKRDRYWRHGQTKPALKALLRKRLPRYDIDRPKLGSGLPVGRFVDSGPLRDHPYVVDPPDFARAKDLGIDRYPPWIAWNILTLSMWRLRVAANPGTPPTSLARRLGSR
jgi:asparagine synthase (glutamine-hydrolysing)